MRALLGSWAIAILLVGCAKESGEAKGDDPAWRAEVAQAISQAEMDLRYWCDPGTSVEGISGSAAQLRTNLRVSAGSVRSMMLESQTEKGATEHDRLIALADFAAMALDLGERVASPRYVGPDPRDAPLELRVLAGSRATDAEMDAVKGLDGLEELRDQKLVEMHEEQAQAFSSGLSDLKKRAEEVRRLEEAAKGGGNVIGLDVAVVERATQCIGEKFAPLYRSN